MFKMDESTAPINSVEVAEGTFECFGMKNPKLSVKMVYKNSKTGTTYGGCDMSERLMSEATQSLFKQFLESAENDFGQIALGSGTVGSDLKPESDEGLSLRGLGKE